jgi:DUF971 family protein
MIGRPWPTALRVKRATRLLEIDFDDGVTFSLPAEFLRVMTPSAEDRGHSGGPGRTVHGKKDVAIVSAEPIGRYAVRFGFSDGHDTGLYSWDELYRLGRDQIRLWSEFLDRLKNEGLTREA